jgi:type I protein arginine methyltransferase
MRNSPLKRLSAALFQALGRFSSKVGDAIRARPGLRPWFYPSEDEDEEARYREFNGRTFADFHEQERMLADGPRMDFYQAAIARHIQPGDRVIDLGTGTGILAAMAARRGAAWIYAIDHSEILAHAREIAAHNGIENVEFVGVHSSAFRLDERVDVILHEQMGDYLFDESMVANVADLRDRLLKPGGLILPSKFELYCEPVKLRDERLVPFLWEMNIRGYDYSCMERSRPQNPGYYHRSSSDLGLVDHFLADPEPILGLDLHTVNDSDLPPVVRFTRRVVNAGRLDGYAVYFRAQVDDDLSLTTSPLEPGRAPHWGFRFLRTDRDDFEVGDEIEVTLSVGRWTDLDSWRWSHVKRIREDGADGSATAPDRHFTR